MENIDNVISTVSKNNYPKYIKESFSFIKANHMYLNNYANVEDFVIDAYDRNNKTLLGIIYHFTNIRAKIARTLWQSEIFIGLSVLDNILFQIFSNNSSNDPIIDFLNIIKNYGLHQPGFVIYPIHSLGILGVGLSRYLNKKTPYFIDKETGIALSPQTNSKSDSIKFIENATNILKLHFKLPYELIDHYNSSRPLKWFVNNPLLLVKVNSFSDGYYENQFLITTKLRLTATLIYLLHSLSVKRKKDRYSYFSSSTMNNFQTLDIYHYLVFQIPIDKSKTFNLNCIPMNISQPELIELSDFNVELDPSEWKERGKLAKRLKMAIHKVQSGYFGNCVTKLSDTSHYKVYNKIFTALKYYKRAHKSTLFYDESAVNLAMGFEILLTDYFSPGVTKRLIERVTKVLKGIKGKSDMIESVKSLLEIRGSVVHTGSPQKEIDLNICFKTFAICFLKIVEAIPTDLDKSEKEPINYIVNNM